MNLYQLVSTTWETELHSHGCPLTTKVKKKVEEDASSCAISWFSDEFWPDEFQWCIFCPSISLIFWILCDGLVSVIRPRLPRLVVSEQTLKCAYFTPKLTNYLCDCFIVKARCHFSRAFNFEPTSGIKKDPNMHTHSFNFLNDSRNLKKFISNLNSVKFYSI